MSIDNIKRVAALIRLLSSDQQGEVLAAVAALRKVCSLNELGDLIEGSAGASGSGTLSNEKIQKIYEFGFKHGYDDGIKKGREEGRHSLHGFQTVFGAGDIQKVSYCLKHKDRLTRFKERNFVVSLVHWTTVLRKPLTPAQGRWLNAIYGKLGGK
jgi:hypothetical protein